MDKFAWGSIILAIIIEGFIVWANLKNPQEVRGNLWIASLFPVVMIGTVLLFYQLQKAKAKT